MRSLICQFWRVPRYAAVVDDIDPNKECQSRSDQQARVFFAQAVSNASKHSRCRRQARQTSGVSAHSKFPPRPVTRWLGHRAGHSVRNRKLPQVFVASQAGRPRPMLLRARTRPGTKLSPGLPASPQRLQRLTRLLPRPRRWANALG